MKKFIVLIMVISLFDISMMARKTEYHDDGGVKSELNKTVDFKYNTFHVDLGIGTAHHENLTFDIGFHIQHNFNPYISWDLVNVRYGRDFSHGNYKAYYNGYTYNYDEDEYNYCNGRNRFTATTGVRGITPGFGKRKNLKFYLACGIGYGGYDGMDYESNYSYTYNGTKYETSGKVVGWRGFGAVDAEFGFYLSKHFYLGLHCLYYIDQNISPHTIRLGYEF